MAISEFPGTRSFYLVKGQLGAAHRGWVFCEWCQSPQGSLPVWGGLLQGSHAAVSWLTRHLVYDFKDFLVGPQEWLFIKPLACSCGRAAEKNSHLASKLGNWLVTSSWATESGWGPLANHTFPCYWCHSLCNSSPLYLWLITQKSRHFSSNHVIRTSQG